LMRQANGTLPWPWIDPDKALPRARTRQNLDPPPRLFPRKVIISFRAARAYRLCLWQWSDLSRSERKFSGFIQGRASG
jgi:hypothetical protein